MPRPGHHVAVCRKPASRWTSPRKNPRSGGMSGSDGRAVRFKRVTEMTSTALGVPIARRMTATIGFRPTEKGEEIIKAAMRSGECKSDVIRRALQLLEREVWIKQARTDAERLRDEDVHVVTV